MRDIKGIQRRYFEKLYRRDYRLERERRIGYVVVSDGEGSFEGGEHRVARKRGCLHRQEEDLAVCSSPAPHFLASILNISR